MTGLARILPFWRDRCGSALAEFALVLPAFLLLTLGTFNLSVLLYAMSTLHSAVESTARCVSLKLTACTNVQTYGASKYVGPSIGPTFVLTAATPANCGNKITGTATYLLVTGVANISVPISASACFPIDS